MVFYEMLTGELPVGRFPPPSQKVEVDVRLDEVVLRTLEKEPSLRYQQASELGTAVESLFNPDWTPTRRGWRRGRLTRLGYEYRSKRTVWGWPLVHVAFSGPTGGRMVARGVIAIGDLAVGLVAIGPFAVGGVTIAGIGLGVFSLGGLSAGLLVAVGGLAFGGFSVGGVALGLMAIGDVALSLWAVSFRVLSLLAGLGTAVVTVAVVTTLVGWLRDAPRHNVPLEPPADHTE